MPITRTTGLEGLFDDAGLFPPCALPMAEALTAHERNRTGPHALLTGPFVCSINRFAELDACVASGLPRPPRLAVITYGEPIAWRGLQARAGIAQVEAPLGTDLSAVPSWLTRYLEVPHHSDIASALDAVKRTGARVKIRCGGLTRDAVPSPLWLAQVLVGSAGRGLTLKATAGLREPYFRHSDDGLHHGFVNLLAAAAAAHAGAPVATVADVLTCPGDLTGKMFSHVGRGRALIESIGTASIDQPVSAIARLGLGAHASAALAGDRPAAG